MKKRILVLEDDAAIRQGVVDALEFDGYETLYSGNGEEGLKMAIAFNYDLLLLDLMLPGMDGLSILKQVRVSRPTLPVIIVTARGTETERIRGLKLGADDYVVKPFGIRELLARIEAVLRRSPERPLDLHDVPIPGGVADLLRSEAVFSDGTRKELSEREVDLLRYLAGNPERVVSREELLQHVWRVNPGAETRTVDMHVARLRDKLRNDPIDPDVILTVRGKGYMFAKRDA